MDTGSTDLRQRDLFGGAMTMKIPSRLTDVSDFRPVPDNQEVFADGDTDQSIIIEIMVARSCLLSFQAVQKPSKLGRACVLFPPCF